MASLDTACLSNEWKYSSFAYDGDVICFMTSPRLVRYAKATKLDKWYIEVIARHGDRSEEEYIYLVPILKNLCIAPEEFLQLIKNVEVADKGFFRGWKNVGFAIRSRSLKGQFHELITNHKAGEIRQASATRSDNLQRCKAVALRNVGNFEVDDTMQTSA